jgi:hypothetical protein
MGSCGWFIPNVNQAQDPGFTCRTYWGTCSGLYWTNSEFSGNHAWRINMGNGTIYGSDSSKFSTFNLRTFRCTAS